MYAQIIRSIPNLLLLCIQQQHSSRGSKNKGDQTSEVLEELKHAKKKAVGVEDYPRAEALKGAIFGIETARRLVDEATASGAWNQLAQVRI